MHEFPFEAAVVCPRGDDGLRLILQRDNGGVVGVWPFSPIADVPMTERGKVTGYEVNVAVHTDDGRVHGHRVHGARLASHVPWTSVEAIAEAVRTFVPGDDRRDVRALLEALADRILEQNVVSIPFEAEQDDADASPCPRCGEWVPGEHELGVQRHEACGWCAHPSRDDGVCGICGDVGGGTYAGVEEGFVP